MQFTRRFVLLARGAIVLILSIPGFAQSGQPCPRNLPGSVITQPENLYSSAGVLSLNLTYQTRVDSIGNTLFCFMNSDGAQSPTLHVQPGDRLLINFTNALPASLASTSSGAMPGMIMSTSAAATCGAAVMSAASANIHYHGTSTAPVCHQDEVITTLVNPGDTFQYDVQIPNTQPPGIYWYHPHVHGISEAAVQGGASGVLIVEGLEQVNPLVGGLPQQIMVVRDNPVPGNPDAVGAVPSWDISINYTPVAYPNFTPAIINMQASEKQFWRVVNASADTILDLQLQYDGIVQPLQVVSLDGTAIGANNGAVTTTQQNDILLGPGARAEFIVTGPALTVQNASLLTLNVNTGPSGDNDPQRPIAAIHALPPAHVRQILPTQENTSTRPKPSIAEPHPGEVPRMRATQSRKLYFSESLADIVHPQFFITVDGQTPALFNPNNPPAIVTTQGSVEDWTIENRAQQTHVFHIHQLHFQVMAVNGVPVTDGDYVDTVNVPFWSGTGPYPSVTLRMDFRGPTTGDFVFHCHILKHEDNGMMSIIRVVGR